LNITDHQIELLILQKVYTDSEYATLIIDYFDKRFLSGFEQQTLGNYWKTKQHQFVEQWWSAG